MKRWHRVLLYASYLLILSSLFVPLSHASFVHFAKDLFIRLAVVVAFSAATFRVTGVAAVEPYRITPGPSQTITKENVPPVEPRDAHEIPGPQSRPKRRRSWLVFWILVLAVYWVTQTSWWAHQLWVSGLMDWVIRWTILLSCWGFLAILWLPKPSANQPETFHIVPSARAESDSLKSMI